MYTEKLNLKMKKEEELSCFQLKKCVGVLMNSISTIQILSLTDSRAFLTIER